MPRQSKRFRQARDEVDEAKLYSLEDALKQIKEAPAAKFDETIDIAINRDNNVGTRRTCRS